MFYKTLLIISICLTMILYSQAQYQSIFGQNSTQWVFEWHNLGIDEQDTIYVEKDTVAFGHNWKKIMVTRYQQQFNGGLLREDTTIGKVWYKGLKFQQSSRDTTQVIVFDYSLNINDTFDIGNGWSAFQSTTTENTVDSIYYLNGKKYIRFKGLYSPGVPPENYLFIEGISGNLGILWKASNVGGLGTPYLLCSYKDGIKTSYVNQRHNGNCNVFGANNLNDYETLSKLISIFPNPAFNDLYFELSDGLKVEKINVFDLQGRRIFIHGNNRNIDISPLSSGTYFIQFITIDHLKINKKIIKY